MYIQGEYKNLADGGAAVAYSLRSAVTRHLNISSSILTASVCVCINIVRRYGTPRHNCW